MAISDYYNDNYDDYRDNHPVENHEEEYKPRKRTLKQKLKLKLWKTELFFTYRFKLIRDIFKASLGLQDEIPF